MQRIKSQIKSKESLREREEPRESALDDDFGTTQRVPLWGPLVIRLSKATTRIWLDTDISEEETMKTDANCSQ